MGLGFFLSRDLLKLPSLVAASKKYFVYTTLWPDRSIIMPVVCHRPVRSNLTVITRYFSLNSPGNTNWNQKGSIRVGFRCLYPACVMAYLLMWLTLITITTGMCLMNVYEFVKVRPAPQSFHNKRRNRWIRIFLFPPVSSLKRYFSTHYLKIFFKFLIAAFTDFATIWKEQPSSCAICS